MRRIHGKSLPVALAAALSFGVAVAQTGGTAPGTASPATSNSGSSATGGRSARMAQPGKVTRKDGKDQLARADRRFIQKAAEGGMFEVQVAQLAQTQASDPAVKSFASMLVDQHINANNELAQLANGKHVELPAAPGFMQRHSINSLGKRKGSDFDRHFVREVGIRDHEKDIKDFEKAGKDVKDADLKAWIEKTLPTLREHLAQAQKLPESGADANAMGNKGFGLLKKSSS